jgi:hypothetical protein
MRGSDERSGELFSYVDLEDRVPAAHPLRLIRRIVNEVLAALDGEFTKLYADRGRPSIPPSGCSAAFGVRRSTRSGPHLRTAKEGPCPAQTADSAPRLTLSTGRPPSFGFGGRFRSDWVAAFRRNRWPLCVGFRNVAQNGPWPSWRALLTSEARERIGRLYATDIKAQLS